MNRILTALFLVAALLGAAFALNRPGASAAAGPCNPASASPASAGAVLSGLNGWRAQMFGVAGMQLSAPANAAAQWYAEQVAAGAASPNSHMDQFGRDWQGRLGDCGFSPYMGGGEAVAPFFASQGTGQSPSDAVTYMTSLTAGHQSGVQAPVAWQCAGVGYAANPGTGSQFRYVWVVVVANAGGTCPQAVTGGGGNPSPTATGTSAATATPTRTATPTATPSPTPSPTPSANYGGTIAIAPGWNLVTLPAGPLSDILDTAHGCFTALYQQQGDHWLRYSPAVPAWANNLTQSNGGGFWIDGTGATGCSNIKI